MCFVRTASASNPSKPSLSFQSERVHQSSAKPLLDGSTRLFEVVRVKVFPHSHTNIAGGKLRARLSTKAAERLLGFVCLLRTSGQHPYPFRLMTRSIVKIDGNLNGRIRLCRVPI